MAHDPRTFPEVSSQGIIIDAGKEAFMGVTAIYTESSPLVRDLEVERRNCIFADEKDVPDARITVFKFYSQVQKQSLKVLFKKSFIEIVIEIVMEIDIVFSVTQFSSSVNFLHQSTCFI